MSELIGASLPRPDALGKVTGATRYPADLIQPGMLHLQVVFALHAHARILSIDSGAALQHPGVVAVLTAKDVPYNAFGLIDADQPVLCGDKVRFEGDKVALVAAKSKQAAIEGARLVAVKYEDLPAVTDPRAALAEDAPLVHEHLRTNQLCHFPLRRGDVVHALAEADVVLEDTFTTTWQEHAFLQPEAGIAYIDEQGRLVLETAGQWLHEDRRQIAQMLKLPEERVVVRYAAIGGAFGGREDLSMQHVLALAAWTLKHPVALVWSREESMIGHHKRHPVRIHCRWGARKDGMITALAAEVIADGGAYASTSVEVVKDIALFTNGCYDIPNLMVDGYAVYTNNIPSGAFRGFGAPQAQFSCEIMVTRLAHELGLDPLAVRRRNIYREGSIEPTNRVLPEGVSALPVLERCIEEAIIRWGYGMPYQQSSQSATLPLRSRGANLARADRLEPENRRPTSPAALNVLHNEDSSTTSPPELPGKETQLAPHLRRGIGIACGIKNVGYSFGFPEQATASVEVFGAAELERADVRIGAADVGQGSHLALRQIASEALGLPLEKVNMICTDSSESPNAGSASASRMTFMGGRAVHDAARAARDKWSFTDDDNAKATIQYRAPKTTVIDPVTHTGVPNYCYGYSAQAVQVEVNLLTGQVQVVGIISVHDVGKAINMQQVTGQIEGCLAQALGYTLMENFQAKDGHILTTHFSTYLLPTVLDMPTEIVPVVLELADPHGPYGARGVAEMPLIPFAPAVASAIHDAAGAWLNQLPMTPERVLTALHEQEAMNEGTE